MRIERIAALSLVCGALASSPVYASDLVADGTFIEGAGAGSFTTYPSGSAIGPWTVGLDLTTGQPSSVDLIGNYWAAPPGGGYSVDLNGTLGNNGASGTDSVGSISQTVTVAIAGMYALTFYVSGNQDGPPLTKTYTVSLGSNDYTLSTSNSAQADQWTKVTEIVSLGVGTDLLTFAGFDLPGNQFGAVIGDVSLLATPLPAALPLFVGGLGVIGLFGRRRKRKAAAIAA